MEIMEDTNIHDSCYLNVLLVDDEDALLASVRRMLQKQCVLKTTNSPRTALEILSKSPKLYDVVVSDLKMPEMNGIDFLVEAKSIAPTTDRILLSGSLSEDELKSAVNRAGISRVLTKPVPASIILSTIRDVVANSEGEIKPSKRMARRVFTALETDHTLAFQPRVFAHDFQVAGIEALSRFPKLQEAFSVEEIITGAEDHPVIGDLALRVLKLICDDHEGIRASYGKVPISINISPYSVSDVNFIASLTEALDYLPCDLSIELEVTEQSNMAFTAEFQRNLPKLRQAGHEVYLDDFGSGNNSIALLRRGVFSGIKIDKSLIARLDDHNSIDSSFVEWSTSIAHQMNMKVIAEGVETLDAAVFLQHIGVDELQGYHFGKPKLLRSAA